MQLTPNNLAQSKFPPNPKQWGPERNAHNLRERFGKELHIPLDPFDIASKYEVLEGDAAVPIADDDTLAIHVNCRADATSNLAVQIPYALMVSLETARPLAVSVYEQVKVALERIRAGVPVRARVRPARVAP